MISSTNLATTLLFDMSQWRSLYLNMCVAASALTSASESLDAPGCSAPFSLEPILAELEVGQYIGPILPAALGDLVYKTGSRGGVSGGGATAAKRKSSTTGGARVRVRYDAHLPTLSLLDG